MKPEIFEDIYQNKLTPKQRQVIPHLLQGLTYSEIADELGILNPNTVTHRVSGIRKEFKALDKKHLIEIFYSFRPALVSEKAIKEAAIVNSKTATGTQVTYEIAYPECSESPNSPFYLSRRNIDSQGERLINTEGCLIKIKAPKQMGKTSLINRLVDYAAQQDNYIVYYDFSFIDIESLSNINSFFYCLALYIAEQVSDLTDKDINLASWNNENSLTTECTKLIKKILVDLDKPLILIFDEVDHIFEDKIVYESFARMLRYWHENGKKSPVWKKLKLILGHSTEEYTKLDINSSPFANVGFTISLPDFTCEEVRELAVKHGIENEAVINSLMELVGGHPYLIRLAFYHLSQEKLPLKQLFTEGATHSGIYKQHLQRHLNTLQENINLKTNFTEVIRNKTPIVIKEEKFRHQLEGMGLIKMEGNAAKVRYKLYQEYTETYLYHHDYSLSA